MSQQIMIAIGRQFGSGGHEVARRLAKSLDIPLYDRNMLNEIGEARLGGAQAIEKFDEAPSSVFSRHVRGISNAPQDAVSHQVFNFIRSRAEAGESFIVLGRCGEEVLKDYPGMMSFFIWADEDFKIKRTVEHDDQTTERDAVVLMRKIDRKRESYHNEYASGKWGETSNYHCTVNSSRLGIDGTVDFIENYIALRKKAME